MTTLQSQSAIANIVKTPASRNFKWDHFEILASGKSDYHCKIKDIVYTAFNVNISSENLMLC